MFRLETLCTQLRQKNADVVLAKPVPVVGVLCVGNGALGGFRFSPGTSAFLVPATIAYCVAFGSSRVTQQLYNHVLHC